MSTRGPEKCVEDALLVYINSINGYAIKNQASPTTGKGRPDISACIDGKYVAIEVKNGKGTSKTTLAQYKHLIDIAYAKGLSYYVNDSEAFETNINKLLKYRKSDWDIIENPKLPPREFLNFLNSQLHLHKIVKVTKTGNLMFLNVESNK